MKEHPILFSGAMVRAILEGRKTQTRRVMKVQPQHVNFKDGDGIVIYDGLAFPRKPKGWTLWPNGKADILDGCPYGRQGDRLWVREAFAAEFTEPRAVIYRADEQIIDWDTGERSANATFIPNRWKPGIHMPRWASRITLEITDVRVQRLQEISREDAEAEGVERWVVGNGWRDYSLSKDQELVGAPPLSSARESFQTLWDSINAERAPWASNPFVWAITFKRIQP